MQLTSEQQLTRGKTYSIQFLDTSIGLTKYGIDRVKQVLYAYSYLDAVEVQYTGGVAGTSLFGGNLLITFTWAGKSGTTAQQVIGTMTELLIGNGMQLQPGTLEDGDKSPTKDALWTVVAIVLGGVLVLVFISSFANRLAARVTNA